MKKKIPYKTENLSFIVKKQRKLCVCDDRESLKKKTHNFFPDAQQTANWGQSYSLLGLRYNVMYTALYKSSGQLSLKGHIFRVNRSKLYISIFNAYPIFVTNIACYSFWLQNHVQENIYKTAKSLNYVLFKHGISMERKERCSLSMGHVQL